MPGKKRLYLAAVCGPTVHISSLFAVEGITEDELETDVIPSNSTFSYVPGTENAPVHQMSWSPRRCRVATLDSSGQNIRVQQISFESSVRDFKQLALQNLCHKVSVVCFAYPNKSGRFVAAGRTDGVVDVYEANKELKLRDQFRCSHLNDHNRDNLVVLNCITWAVNDSLIIVGDHRGSLHVHLFESSDNVASEVTNPLVTEGICQPESACLVLRTSRSDTSLVAAGYASGLIVVWHLTWPVSSAYDHLIAYSKISPISSLKSVPTPGLLDIAFSPVDSHIIATAGLPDLHLRLWRMRPSTPVKSDLLQTFVSSVSETGYLVVDIASDGFTLATGLVNGQVWIYDVRSLSKPVKQFNLDSLPVSSLFFAIHPNDEVRFDETLGPSFTEVSSLLDTKRIVSNRKPLTELANFCADLDVDDGSLLKEFSLSALSSFSSGVFESRLNSFDSSAPAAKASTIPVDSPVILPNHGKDSCDQSADKHNSDMQTVLNEGHLDCREVGSLSGSHLERLFMQFQEKLNSRLDNSFSQMLLYFCNLEVEVKKMSKEFETAITRLEHENKLLREELERKCYFY